MLGTRVLAMVLAGGAGERLRPLTYSRCKPAVPFGGNFRVIDFTLLNCVSSHLRRIYILTQYRAETLDDHCRDRWRAATSASGLRIQTVPPAARSGSRGSYSGTADAVYQNLAVLRSERPSDVLILSGDHVYHADYEKVVRKHIKRRADVTIVTGEVGADEASSFGVVETTPDEWVTRFVEKPLDPWSYARHGRCRINLGVYCFRAGFLAERLREDAGDRWSSHDFGKDILPRALGRGAVLSCPLQSICPDRKPYWRDVGTLDSFFESHLDLLGPERGFQLTDPRWSSSAPFHDWVPERVPARDARGRRVRGWNIVSRRVTIDRARVANSVLSYGVSVHRNASVDECLLFRGAQVGSGARLRRVIVEEGVSVPPGTEIGYGYGAESAGSAASQAGVVVYTGVSSGDRPARPRDPSEVRRIFSRSLPHANVTDGPSLTSSRKSS